MDAFHWNKNFETGLNEVDTQHHILVDLINRLGELLHHDSDTTSDIESVFSELVAYTQFHFREEEAMMQSVGLDTRFIVSHINLHSEFLQQVEKMHASVKLQQLEVPLLMLKYLVHWLAFHILGIDQSMSRQVSAIHAGKNPEAIFEQEAHLTQQVTGPLLQALDSLFQQISEQNNALLDLNQTLEKKVMDRTSALSEANQRLEELALTDALTGLPNRRHAMARISKEWAYSIQQGTPLACMMIDADGFKQINDTYGHDAGDDVLCQLSKQLRYSVRTDDAVCRLGGDEFLIICPNTNQSGAMRIAEQIRQAISESRVPAGDGVWIGSVSIGVATRMPNMLNPEDLIKAADDGVYIAKHNGRNCVACSLISV